MVEKEAEAQAERLRHLCSDENGAEFQKGAASFPSRQLPPRPVMTCGMMPSGRAWPFPVKSPKPRQMVLKVGKENGAHQWS